MINNSKIIPHRINKILLIVILLGFPYLSVAQTDNKLPKTDSTQNYQSPFSLGLSLGYTGIFVSSHAAENTFGKDFVNGMSFGIIFEYKFDDTKTSLQFLSESNLMNIKFEGRNQDSVIYSSFTMLGIKAFLGFAEGFYVLPAAGIITGYETAFVRSISIGYESANFDKKSSSFFVQTGFAFNDYKDGFLTVRMGLKINL